MDAFTGEVIGDIHVTVFKTPDDDRFFYVKANNEDILPIRYIIEDALNKY